jgi:hypothetical protein
MTTSQDHATEPAPLTVESIGGHICTVRGQRVLLDADLARLYGVPTKAIKQAVARNPDRFPRDFAFPLAITEVANLRSQTVTSSWGGRRYGALAFTEQGVAMLSSVLRSTRAARVNVAIMRAFVLMRRALVEHTELARRVDSLERKVDTHDERIAAIFEAIRQLLRPARQQEPKERIGFTRNP